MSCTGDTMWAEHHVRVCIWSDVACGLTHWLHVVVGLRWLSGWLLACAMAGWLGALAGWLCVTVFAGWLGVTLLAWCGGVVWARPLDCCTAGVPGGAVEFRTLVSTDDNTVPPESLPNLGPPALMSQNIRDSRFFAC